jgi:hypothetical protein
VQLQQSGLARRKNNDASAWWRLASVLERAAAQVERQVALFNSIP